jgi:hypothetical protein
MRSFEGQDECTGREESVGIDGKQKVVVVTVAIVAAAVVMVAVVAAAEVVVTVILIAEDCKRI